MKKLTIAVCVVLPLAATAVAQMKHPQTRGDGSFDELEMYRFHLRRVNDTFWTGGQPPISELKSLKEAGIKVILDLQATNEHDVAAEAAEAKRLGMRYINIPVEYMAPKPEQLTEFLKLTDDPQNRPMFIHCTMAIRASAFWMARRVLRDGWTLEKAEAEAQQLGPPARHLREFARDYIAKDAGATAKPQAEATPREPYLVTPAWLIEHFADKDLVLLHVGDKAEYDAAHLPGAVYVDRAQLSLPRETAGLTLQMGTPEQLKETFEKWGVSNSSRVIVYFGKDWITPTARIILTLEYLGLGDRASILDGGMPAWREAGQPVTAEVKTPERGSITPNVHAEVIADADWVLAHLKDPAVTIVDARNTTFYQGNPGGFPRGGHIPGAVSIPFSDLSEDSGKVEPRAVLEASFRDAGVKPGTLVVTYCHIGQQASFVYLVARMLGYQARMYDGSFEEWSKRPELPVETPPAPPAPDQPKPWEACAWC